MIGASDDDCKLLIMKQFIIPFESGIVVIKHWRIHNYIRSDRKKNTNYIEEMASLTEKENGEYSLICVADKCRSSVGQVSDKCQRSIDKDRLDKDSLELGKNSKKSEPHGGKYPQARNSHLQAHSQSHLFAFEPLSQDLADCCACHFASATEDHESEHRQLG